MRALLVIATCVGLVGCQVSTTPTPVAQFDRGHGVAMMRAPWDGQYTLYLLAPEGNGRRTLVQAAHLKRNDPLGFRQRDAGPVAVADGLEVPLGDGSYEWVMQPDPGQPNWVATTLLTVVIVGATVGTVAILGYLAAEDAASHIFRSRR